MTFFHLNKVSTNNFLRYGIRKIYCVIALCLLSFISSFTLNAAELKMLALVSDRSAASMVTGAHQFLATQADVDDLSTQSSITIRSVNQLNQLTNNEIQQLINQHQALIIAGVFGESVERLLALNYPFQQPRLMLNTDRRLMVLHQDVQGGNVENLSKKQLQSLMVSLDKSNYLTALAKKQEQWPQFAYWLQARAYWQNRGKENLGQLFNWLGKITTAKSGVNNKKLLTQAATIRPLQPIRFYWQQQLISIAELKDKIVQNQVIPEDKPLVFIIDHDTGDQPGQWQLHQQLCQRQWQCVSVLAGWGKPSEQAIEIIRSIESSQPMA